jgi:adenylylsulfate kinase
MTTTNATAAPLQGFVLWFTGLSGSGKSTLTEALAPELKARGCKVEVLDGDVVRTHLSRGLGFSREDRDTNILRIGFVANLLARNGVGVITAAISPYRETRDACRAMVESGDTPFIEAHVAASLEECEARDVKGLYAEARAGKRPGFTGIDDPYEPPLHPEIVLPTGLEPVEASVARVLDYLARRGLVGSAKLAEVRP